MCKLLYLLLATPLYFFTYNVMTLWDGCRQSICGAEAETASRLCEHIDNMLANE